MTEILFYHLEHRSLDDVLPSLVEKSLGGSLREMMRVGLLATVLSLAGGIANAAQVQTLDPALATVFPAEKARELLEQQVCLRVPANVSSTWTPSTEEIGDLEAELPKALAEANPHRIQDIGLNFARQYGGLEIDGERIIYINAFPSGLLLDSRLKMPDWHSHAIEMCDSGRVFGAEYDPQTKKFSHFEFEVPLQ